MHTIDWRGDFTGLLNIRESWVAKSSVVDLAKAFSPFIWNLMLPASDDWRSRTSRDAAAAVNIPCRHLRDDARLPGRSFAMSFPYFTSLAA
jgi:hypothetical protein